MKIKIITHEEGEKPKTRRINLPLWLAGTRLFSNLIYNGITGQKKKKSNKKYSLAAQKIAEKYGKKLQVSNNVTEVAEVDNGIIDNGGETDLITESLTKNELAVDNITEVELSVNAVNETELIESAVRESLSGILPQLSEDDISMQQTAPAAAKKRGKREIKNFLDNLGVKSPQLQKLIKSCLKELRKYKGLVIVDVQSADTTVQITI